jgi:uracil-DNA glycosylase
VYFKNLDAFLSEEKKTYTIYPPLELVYAAFNHCQLHQVKAVILGQDPYHNIGQANGLSFSVPPFIKIPPSLKNIFKELKSDLNIEPPFHGDLTPWTKQGVLLLNATLTVRANGPGTHQKKGWEIFTDTIIKTISEEKENLVFLLWGNYAIAKSNLIDQTKHKILMAHPSPLARGGFFGCKHFSQTNAYLISKKISPINWNLEM